MLIYRPTIISGSGYYSGSFDGDGSRLYNIPSSSYAITASYSLNGGFGSQGNQGPAGSQGFTGAQGNQGPTGLQGISGTNGFQGNQGPTGLQGSTGLQGTQGFQGSAGLQGTQGFQGSTGISSGATYYFNQSNNSDVSPYKVLSLTPSGSQQTVTSNLTRSEQNRLVSSFLTPELGFAVIPGGVQRFHLHFLKPASNDNIEVYATIQLANSAGSPIGSVVSTNIAALGWVSNVIPVEIVCDLVLPTTTIDPTNRMIVKLYLSNLDSTSHSVIWYTQGTSYYSFVVTTTGVIGNQGPQGNQGPTGLQGSTGSQGVQGLTGLQGFQGNAGTNVSETYTVSASFSATSSITIAHNFNSKNVIVSTYDSSDVYFIPQSLKLVDENKVKLTFTSPSTGYVVVAKGGHIVSGSLFIPGPQGNQGPLGFQGLQGNQGLTGAQGVQGSKGEVANNLLYTTTISGSIITINHNTDNAYPLFAAYNQNKIVVQPKTVLSINPNTIEVDFGTFFTGSISVGGSGLKGKKGDKGNFKGEKGIKGQKGNDIFPFFGNAIITGSLNVSNSSSFSHIIPKQNNLYDLGSPTKRWRDIYLTSASIYLGKTKISANNQGKLSIINSENPSQKTIGDYSGSFTGSIKLPVIPQGTTETNILLVNNYGNLVYRSNLSLKGSQGPAGSNAGITSYTNPGGNRVITSISSTEINAEENLTFNDSVLSVNTTAGLKIPIGSTAQRPVSPSDGLIRLNTSLKSLEFFYNSAWANIMSANMIVEYLVIAGGGGRGIDNINGSNPGFGGAGGYKSSVYGERSGGSLQSLTDMQMPLVIKLTTPYEIIIGAGATSVGGQSVGNNGSPSSFYRIFCLGGGGGQFNIAIVANSGGSGGGHNDSRYVGSGTVSQGHNGQSLGGGGAGGLGSTTLENSIESSITGTPTKRAAGGGSLNAVYASNLGTGSGGAAGSGGWSGVVILRYSAALTLTNPTGGLTFLTSTSNSYKVTTFTQGTGNIVFNF